MELAFPARGVAIKWYAVLQRGRKHGSLYITKYKTPEKIAPGRYSGSARNAWLVKRQA
jgi:hypothetical protein